MADKTGSLFATRPGSAPCRPARRLDVVEAVAALRRLIGTAFQLSDDLIDIASESGQSGKTPGTDLREGVEHAAGAARPGRHRRGGARLRELLAGAARGRRPRTPRRSPCCARTRRSTEARSRLADVLAEARATAERLPAGPARAALLELAAFVVERTG